VELSPRTSELVEALFDSMRKFFDRALAEWSEHHVVYKKLSKKDLKDCRQALSGSYANLIALARYLEDLQGCDDEDLSDETVDVLNYLDAKVVPLWLHLNKRYRVIEDERLYKMADDFEANARP
jgi:hypothetical protein